MPRVSTRDLSAFPDPAALERQCRALAVADAIIEPEWQYRYFSYDAEWDTAAGERMASMRDGCGDDVFILFFADGRVAVKGLAHETPMAAQAWAREAPYPGLVESIPEGYEAFVDQPAFEAKLGTFWLWRSPSDTRWHTARLELPAGDDPDGSEALLEPYLWSPADYVRWVREYYERDVPLAAIERIFRHEPLDEHVLEQLNPSLRLEDVAAELEAMAYPSCLPRIH